MSYMVHTRLTMYYIRPFLYDTIKVSLRFNQCYFTQYIDYSTNCIDAVIKSIQSGTITVHTETNTLRKVILTESYRNLDRIVKKQYNVIHS